MRHERASCHPPAGRQVILITGASSRLGLETAKQLASQGEIVNALISTPVTTCC
jgi:NAD(P)-dependent dehydrogenase (short-subunit alcohol dehydrogenase family)